MSQRPSDLIQDDLEKFQRYSGDGGMDFSPAAIIELSLLSLTGFVALGWLVAIFWVPDPIDGQVWMGLGALGLVVFGLPTGLIMAFRRGAGEIALAMLREIG